MQKKEGGKGGKGRKDSYILRNVFMDLCARHMHAYTVLELESSVFVL